MAEELTDQVFDRFIKRFEDNVMEKVRAELISGRLDDGGRVRSNIRKDMQGIFCNNLEFNEQMKLVAVCGKQLLEVGEFPLARECFQKICDESASPVSSTPKNLDMFRITIEARQNVICCDHADITQAGNFYIAPMRVSRLLGCLAAVRDVLDTILALPGKDQENFAWLVLNGCKMIYTIGHPLLWLDCAKYVHESLFFASLCLDAVINLCTTRHLNFRMKVCSAAFSSLVTHSSHEEVFSFLEYVTRKVSELREREQLDPPLTESTVQELERAETDLSVMRVVMDFWQNPDSLSLSALPEPFPRPDSSITHPAPNAAAPFAEKCLMECIRTQELTAGNTNEPWRKRSSSLLHAFMAYSEQYVDPSPDDEGEEGAPEEKKAEGGNEEKPKGFMTVECLVSLMSLAMFDELEGVDHPAVLQRVEFMHSLCPPPPESDLSNGDFVLLKALTLYISTASSSSGSGNCCDSTGAALHLVASMHDMIHSDRLSVRKTLLRRLALGVWSKAVYPSLQRVLAAALREEFPSEGLITMISPLTTAAVSLVFSGIEDPVLLGSMSIIIAQLLNIVGDSRRCISFLSTAVEYIDDHRAARVDMRLHYPDDVSDVKALQHASFTCRSDNAQHWHASAKRLGAHAFAGFGIFGTASSMAGVDQALCDVHLDLLSLLFRFELSYAIVSRTKCSLLKASAAPQDAKSKEKTAKLVSTISNNSGATVMSSGVAVTQGSNVDSLPCISYLRSSWGKSSYSRSVLLVEMARVERKPEKKLEYLREAVECVQEAERREAELQSGFSDLTVVSASAARHPVVVARSHAFFYVSPVACRKDGLDKVDHFRVFGREEGSGTDISVTSDELGGCDELVSVSDMKSPATCAVRISSLRPGEKYAFASAGFSKDGQIVGQISPTSQSIEATNPLPIISLRANICLLADDIGEHELSSRISAKVCDYFIKVTRPKQENRTFAKGLNAYSYDRCFFNMLALQQASPVQLRLFVRCFLASQAQFVEGASRNPLVDSTSIDIFEVQIHWNFKSSEQFKIASNCHKLALVSTVASMCNDHELIVRCVCLGYSLVSQSLLFDISQVAQVLFNPILVFLSALKVTPKVNWQTLDHQLYCRLLLCAIKCAVVTGNVSSLTPILTDLYSPEEEKEEGKGGTDEGDGEETKKILPEKILHEYSKLLLTMKQKANLLATPDVVQQMHELLSLQDYDADKLDETPLWSMSNIAREQFICNAAAQMTHPEPSGMVLKVQEQILLAPHASSQLIDTVVYAAMQLQAEGKVDEVRKMLSLYPIRRDYLAVTVNEECAKWGVDFVCEPPVLEEADEELGEIDGGAPPAPVEQHNHLLLAAESEMLDQFRGIAHLCLLQADSCVAADMYRNDFPEAEDGPYLQLSDVMLEEGVASLVQLDGEASTTAAATAATTATATATGPDIGEDGGVGEDLPLPPIQEKVDPKVIYLKRLITAVILFVRAKYFQSAVDATLKMWKFVTDEWHSPLSFSAAFFSLKQHLLGLSVALVAMLEAQCNGSAEPEEGEEVGCATASAAAGFHPRTVKQNLFVLRFPVTFVLKALCLFQLSKDVVEIGLRVLDVYVHHGAEYSNVVCDHCCQYLLFSQEKIISKNTETVHYREKKLNNFIFNWEEMQAKKRKKKMRVVKVEKSDDELKFDAEKAMLNDKLERSQSTLEFSHQKKDFILQIEKRVDGANTSGQQLFDRVRKSSTAFIVECRKLLASNPEQFPTFPSILKKKSELKRFNEIVGHYDQVILFLREKKDTINLVSALHEEGDFYLLFGLTDMAQGVWRDGVDGYFNVLDAWKDWQSVAEAAVQNVNLHTAGCVFTVITMLSKLSKHCSANNMDLKSNYCQLAAKLCLIPFKETLNHPVDLHGFAAYNCVELGGRDSFEFDSDTFSSFSFHNGLDEVIRVLGSEKLYFVSLPLLVLWEHFHGVYTCRADQWLMVRLRRIQFLAEMHFFSEATSMLSAMRPSLRSIQGGYFSDFLLKISAPMNGSGGIAQEVSSNGFEFPDCPPFYNNETIGSDANQLSIAWIITFPEEFLKLSDEFKVVLPSPPADEAPPPAVVEEVVEDKKKKGKGAKGKKKGGEEETVVVEDVKKLVPTRPLFSRIHHSEVNATCALFLTEMSSMDSRVMVEHHSDLQSTLLNATSLVRTASSLLLPEGSDDVDPLSADNAIDSDQDNDKVSDHEISCSWNSSQWVSLYGKCRLLHFRQLCLAREYRNCRANCLHLLKHLKVVSDVYSSARFELSHLWMSTEYILADAAECQARLDDVLKISQQGVSEASSMSSSFWSRRFQHLVALGQFKRGDVSACEECCEKIKASYQMSKLCSLESIRGDLLYVSVLHTRLQGEKDLKAVQVLGAKCIATLRGALRDATTSAVKMGFVGEDSNLTFESPTSSLMKHDRFTPFMYGITSLHTNYPDMTSALTPAQGKGGGRHHPGAESVQNLFQNQTLRAGPVDVFPVHPESQLCNIYLEEVQVHAECCTALCLMLDEVRGAVLFTRSDGNSGNSEDSSFDASELLKEQIQTGEMGLKLLRHVAYPSPFLKASLFLSVGKTRATESSVQCLEGIFPGCEDFLTPLTAGLEVSMAGPHQWQTMKANCLEIVECYGNQSLRIEIDAPSRLKMAVKYLLLCARLDNNQFDVEHNSLRLLEEVSLIDTTCPEESAKLLLAMTSSSLFSFGQSKKSGEQTTVPGARDAFLLLSALSREQNQFLVNGRENSFLYDLLKSMRQSFPQVEDRLFVRQLPSVDEDLEVTEASVTCVWSATAAAVTTSAAMSNRGKSTESFEGGLFPRLTGYVLLGGLKESTEGTSSGDGQPPFVSEEPYLRKVSVTKVALVGIEGQMVAVFNRLLSAEAAADCDDELANAFCVVLKALFSVLQGKEDQGIDQGDDNGNVTIDVCTPTEESQGYTAAVSLGSTKICDLDMKSSVMQQFIEVFSQDKSCHNLLCIREVCLFLWGALRL